MIRTIGGGKAFGGASILAVLGLALSLGACSGPNPEEEYNEFAAATADMRGGGAADIVVEAVEEDFSGDYLLGIQTPVGGPLMAHVTVELRDVADGEVIDFTFQPVKTDVIPGTSDPRADARTPTGDPIVATDVPFEDGTFRVDLGEVTVPGDANPITGSDIVATLLLDGVVISNDEFCGLVEGQVTVPIPLELAPSSTFGALKTDDVTTAQVSIACPGGPAEPEPDMGPDVEDDAGPDVEDDAPDDTEDGADT